MDRSMNHHHHQHHHLGVNKLGKLIKKESDAIAHRPSPPPPAQPRANGPSPSNHIYNISKNDFRSFVQQFTGSGGDVGGAVPRPPQQQRPRPSQRLHQIRPPPLASVPAPAPPPPAKFPAESPVTAYMRYLENSLLYSDGSFGTPAASSSAPAIVRSPAMIRPPAWFGGALSPYSLLSPGLMPPMSPAVIFPQSPSGFLVSPRWRNDK